MYQAPLASIIHYYNTNKPGICSVIGVPVDDVLQMPDIKKLMRSNITVNEADFFVQEISLKTGKVWYDISKDVNYKMRLAEKDVKTDQGKQFEYTLEFEIPNDKFDSRLKIFRAYDNREWILIVKERSGIWRVLGSKQKACEFKSELNTGAVGNGVLNQYACGFVWQSSHRAYAVRNFSTGGIVYEIEIPVDTDLDPIIVVTTDGPVIINSGNGNTEHYYTPPGTPQIINVTATGGGPVLVQHNNDLNLFEANGPGIESIGGDLPSTLERIVASGLQLTAIASLLPPTINYIDVRDNDMHADEITAILQKLDLSGVEDGTGKFEDQSVTNPYLAGLNPAGLTAKANLIGKGWTITHDND